MNTNNHNGNGSDKSPLLKALDAVKDLERKGTEMVSISLEDYDLVLLQLDALKETILHANDNISENINVIARTLLQSKDIE